MTVGRAVQLLIAATAVIFVFTACGKGSARDVSPSGSDINTSTIDRSTVLESDPETESSTASRDAIETTTAQPVPVTPPRPEGGVPQSLVGVWSGGEGDKTGYRLTFFADSTYEIVHERRTAIPRFREVGYCVGDSSRLLLRPVMVEGPVERRERTARWGIQQSSVVDVLTVTDQFDGEFSYVRIG